MNYDNVLKRLTSEFRDEAQFKQNNEYVINPQVADRLFEANLKISDLPKDYTFFSVHSDSDAFGQEIRDFFKGKSDSMNPYYTNNFPTEKHDLLPEVLQVFKDLGFTDYEIELLDASLVAFRTIITHDESFIKKLRYHKFKCFIGTDDFIRGHKGTY